VKSRKCLTCARLRQELNDPTWECTDCLLRRIRKMKRGWAIRAREIAVLSGYLIVLLCMIWLLWFASLH
jgi:DNA-directed RNA polymerase subunit RPC12/RpoP